MTTTRRVSAEIELDVREPADLVWSVAVADGPALASEPLAVTVDGAPLATEEVRVDDGGRLHVCRAPVGRLRLSTPPRSPAPRPPPRSTRSTRSSTADPSRYAESDELGPTAWAEFSNWRARPCSTPSARGSARSSTTSAAPAGTPTAPPRPCWPARASAATTPTW